jgi:hypothetical protein
MPSSGNIKQSAAALLTGLTLALAQNTAVSQGRPISITTGQSTTCEELVGQNPEAVAKLCGEPLLMPIAVPDITSLVPTAVELSTPALCGDVTVYDQEDVATFCGPGGLAAPASTSIVSSTCPQLVSGVVRLEVDLACADTDGLIVTADNTIIDLNGHRITCKGAGYLGSCQGGLDDDGVDTDGFDNGVWIRSDSDNVKVKQLTITGPPAPMTGPTLRPLSFGILVAGPDCNGGNIRLGGGSRTGNDISNHLTGIFLNPAACVYIGYNFVHDNSSTLFVGDSGIDLTNAPNNHVRSNIVTRNGNGQAVTGFADAGVQLFGELTVDCLLTENQVNQNMGHGIEALQRTADNYIVNNQMLFNTRVDAFSDQTSVNRWNENNRCQTQTTPEPPPGVCNPNEVPPPQ